MNRVKYTTGLISKSKYLGTEHFSLIDFNILTIEWLNFDSDQKYVFWNKPQTNRTYFATLTMVTK